MSLVARVVSLHMLHGNMGQMIRGFDAGLELCQSLKWIGI